MRTYRFILFALTFTILTACLDESPRDSLNEDQAYNSARNLYINSVATLYNYIGGNEDFQGLQGTKRGVYDYNTLTTDEAIIPIRGGDWYDGGFWQDLFNHNWKADDEALYGTWKYLYKVVVLCNESLQTLAERRSLLTDEEYNTYCAEVRAIRALFYAYIMDMYGNVLSQATRWTSTAMQSKWLDPTCSVTYSTNYKKLNHYCPMAIAITKGNATDA